MVLLDVVGRQRTAVVVSASLVVTGFVAAADYATGQDLSFNVFYVLPVLLAASKGTSIGARIATCSAAAWFVADLASRTTPYSSMLVPLWNVAVRFLVFFLVVALAGALARSLELEQELSRRDPLSGLANTRAFIEIAERERRRMMRTGRPLTIAYLDIDDFKKVNDTLGHAAGDAVITETAHALQEGVRDTDVVARLGGDEFAVLLPETAPLAASVVMQRVHERLTVQAADNSWPIGYSIGVVTFENAPADVDELVRAADQLMYEVKRTGKRAVRTATVSMSA